MSKKTQGKGRERWWVANNVCARWNHGPWRLVDIQGVAFAECRFCRVIPRRSYTDSRLRGRF